MVLVYEDLFNLSVSGSVDLDAGLDDSDSSLLILGNSSDLRVHNVSESSDLLSGLWSLVLLKLDDVLGGSLDNSESLLSEGSERLPVLLLVASELFVEVTLGHSQSVELSNDFGDLVSVMSGGSYLLEVLVDSVGHSLVLELVLDLAFVGSALSHLGHVVVVLLLESLDLLSVGGDLLVSDLNQLLSGDHSMDVSGLGNQSLFVLDDLSLGLVHDQVLSSNLFSEGLDLLSDDFLLFWMGLDIFLELGDLDLVGFYYYEGSVSLVSELVVDNLDLSSGSLDVSSLGHGHVSSLLGRLFDEVLFLSLSKNLVSLLDLKVSLSDPLLVVSDSLGFGLGDNNDDLLRSLDDLSSVSSLGLLLVDSDLLLSFGDLLISSLDSLGVRSGLDNDHSSVKLVLSGLVDVSLNSLGVDGSALLVFS